MLTATAWSSRTCFGPSRFPWHELAAIEFEGVESDALSDMDYYEVNELVFVRRDGYRVTSEAPRGGTRPGEYLFELRERLLAMRSVALEGDREDSWPGYPTDHPQPPTDQPKRPSQTLRDWLLYALFGAVVVLFGLPAFLIVVLDSLSVVGDWLTVHVPFWDEVTDFFDWLWSDGS